MSAARFRPARFRRSLNDPEPFQATRPVSLRRVLIFATWLTGTLLATATVYEAVHTVGGQVTGLQAEGLSQAKPAQALKLPAAASPSASQAVPISTPSAPPGESTGPQPATTSPGGLEARPAPANPPPPAPTNDTRTIALVGGTASVTCSGGQIRLNWATPNSGFEVETGSSNGGALIEVRFRSDAHESRLEAWCSGGLVQSSIREEPS